MGWTGVATPVISDDILIGAQARIVDPHQFQPPKNGRCFAVDDAARLVMILGGNRLRISGVEMVPLYAVRIEDLGQGDFVKVDCAGCSPTPRCLRLSSLPDSAWSHATGCSI
jgi:hypothetical protein